MNDLIVQSINSIVFSMLLFIMAAGLSLIFGHMNFINLAHGSFYVLGGYIGYTMISKIGSYWVALLIVPILVGLAGATIEFLFLRRLYGKRRHLEQVLFTMGLALITADIIRSNWGTYVVTMQTPKLLVNWPYASAAIAHACSWRLQTNFTRSEQPNESLRCIAPPPGSIKTSLTPASAMQSIT